MKIIPFIELEHLKSKHQGKTIIHCHGVFDLIHCGHLEYFKSAKALGELLVVTITSDKYVNKGPYRPHFTDMVRAEMLSAFEIIDFVSISNYPTAREAISLLKPDCYVKGPDYKDASKDLSGGIIDEELAVRKNGGEIVFTSPKETFSSTSLINENFSSWSDAQIDVIDGIKALGGNDALLSVFKEMKKLKVMVIGEPIIDVYVFSQPEGISSKSPSISARRLYKETYPGGSLAIANSLSDFVDEVHLFAPYGYEDMKTIEKVDKRICIHAPILREYSAPKKTRFVEPDKLQRFFQDNDIQNDIWLEQRVQKTKFINDILDLSHHVDLILMCDFGHGLFEGEVLQLMGCLEEFKTLNCQTNSSNQPFNSYTKHKHDFNYLSIDLREARLAFSDHDSKPLDLFSKLYKTKHQVSMTLGSGGSLYSGDKKIIECPTFTDKVLDATGAGDSYFAITSLMTRLGAQSEFVPFVGNVYAGLSTRGLANKQSVSREMTGNL